MIHGFFSPGRKLNKKAALPENISASGGD